MEMKARVGLWNGLERVPTEVVFIIGFNTEKDSKFVVMHGHFCLSGPVKNGGKGGGHKEEEVGVNCNASRSFKTLNFLFIAFVPETTHGSGKVHQSGTREHLK